MFHTHIQTDGPWQRLRPILPEPKTKRITLILSMIGLVLTIVFVYAWWTARAPSSVATAINPKPASVEIASVTDLRGGITDFEQHTRLLVEYNSPVAYQMLIQYLKQSEPLTQRAIVLTALQKASPIVVPELITALSDPDAGVRAGTAEALGLRGEYQAIAALTIATRDVDASVRWEAVKSLSALDAWQVLPRLEQLGVNESNSDVRQAAIAAQELFKNEMAQAIGVLAPELRDISVTTGDAPQIYAVTPSDLYARRGAAWTLVSRLPDAPLAIATGADPNLIYLATVSAGLYRSINGGETWDHVQFGLATPTQLIVTAITIDPQKSRRVYIALAARGAELGVKDPLGIGVSDDGGATWEMLQGSPIKFITTRLILDPHSPEYLFGMAGDTPWQYTLPIPVCSECLD